MSHWNNPAFVAPGRIVEIPVLGVSDTMRIKVHCWPYGVVEFHPTLPEQLGVMQNVLLFSSWREVDDQTGTLPPPSMTKSEPVCIHCREPNAYAEVNRPDGTFLCFGCKPHAWRYE